MEAAADDLQGRRPELQFDCAMLSETTAAYDQRLWLVPHTALDAVPESRWAIERLAIGMSWGPNLDAIVRRVFSHPDVTRRRNCGIVMGDGFMPPGKQFLVGGFVSPDFEHYCPTTPQ